MPTEPLMTINGQPLTPAQALTVRCALDAFRTTLETLGLPGEAAQSQRLTAAYLARLTEVQALIGVAFEAPPAAGR